MAKRFVVMECNSHRAGVLRGNDLIGGISRTRNRELECFVLAASAGRDEGTA